MGISRWKYMAPPGQFSVAINSAAFQLHPRIGGKLAIVPSVARKAAERTPAGRLTSILVSMQVFQDYDAAIRQKHHDEFVSRDGDGAFTSLQEKLNFDARCKSVFAQAEADWKMLQVSLVAGA